VRRRPLVLTYHAVAEGPAPLFVAPELLAQHLDCVVESGATVLSVSALVEALHRNVVPDNVIVLTFDDGFADTVNAAAPLLADRGLTATVFCVSGHVGGMNDWSSQPAAAPRLPLADAGALRALVAAGWEIGAHGVAHRPLGEASAGEVRAELASSREALEKATGAAVTSFAWPYGSVPRDPYGVLAETGYAAAFTTRVAAIAADTHPLSIPRVDAHYVRSPALLAAVLAGRRPGYLALRRGLATARRRVIADHVGTGSGE
jgi:peptidoglycan/xylan/chitin deacetylase (PgdA/CDA1 family)